MSIASVWTSGSIKTVAGIEVLWSEISAVLLGNLTSYMIV